jgi:hypothetical protein
MRTSAIFFRLCPYYSIFKELENLGHNLLRPGSSSTNIPGNTDVPTILVDLGLFRGKKYFDFKNFSNFVKTQKTEIFEILGIFIFR